jgi:hypothetical protein
MSSAHPASAPDEPAIPSRREAEEFAARLHQLMEALVAVVEEETRLVRRGRLADTASLEQPKADLARTYLAQCAQLKRLAPALRQHHADLYESLRQRHDTFRALLQINLTVLATAHAVAEGLVRGVADEIARKTAPQTYAASGRPAVPPRSAAAPLAVSRSL